MRQYVSRYSLHLFVEIDLCALKSHSANARVIGECQCRRQDWIGITNGFELSENTTTSGFIIASGRPNKNGQHRGKRGVNPANLRDSVVVETFLPGHHQEL